MRSENEGGYECSLEQSKSEDDASNFHKNTKISYTPNELISLSVLDPCKRLPSGVDQSVGDLGIWSTGLLHSCFYSDSGTSRGFLPQHLHPNHECGLLRSGTAGDSDQLVKSSGFHLLNRSDGAYRPPHLCKAKVRSMGKYEDFYNNETFGSFKNLSLERAEEERRRRDSFELMRKEKCEANQNKLLHEHKENLDPENGLLLEASGSCKMFIQNYNESEECVASQAEASAPAGNAFSAQTNAFTFLLPSVLESKGSSKSTITSELCENKRDHIKRYRLHSSGFHHQFLSDDKLVDGISSGYLKEGFKLSAAHNEEASQVNSANLLSGRNELMENLMASTTFPVSDEVSGKLHWTKSISPSKSVPGRLRIPNCMKQNVTPLVLPRKYYELHSINHNSMKGWSTNYTNGIDCTPDADRGATNYPSLENKWKHQKTVEASSPLNWESIYQKKFSEIEGLLEDLRTTEFSGIQRDSVSMSTRNGIVKSHRFPCESGSIKINCEYIRSSSSSKQTVVSKIEENLSSSNALQAKTGFNLQDELKCLFSSASGFCENAESQDELFLPDEDSLITTDDCILPQGSTSMPAGCLLEENFLTSSSQVNIADKPAALNPFCGDKRSTQLGLEGLGSYFTMGSKNSKADLHTLQCYPQFNQYQMNPGRATFKSSDAQQVQMQSSNPKTITYAPELLDRIPAIVLSDKFQNPHTNLRRCGHPMKSPFPQQMPIPNNFAHHQFPGFPRGSQSHSPSPICGMTSYSQELQPPQYFPHHCQQQNYEGFRMPNSGHFVGVIGSRTAVSKPFEIPNSDHSAGVNGNQAAVVEPIHMEARPRQTHPLPIAGRGSGNFGKEVGTGVWFGQLT